MHSRTNDSPTTVVSLGTRCVLGPWGGHSEMGRYVHIGVGEGASIVESGGAKTTDESPLPVHDESLQICT